MNPSQRSLQMQPKLDFSHGLTTRVLYYVFQPRVAMYLAENLKPVLFPRLVWLMKTARSCQTGTQFMKCEELHGRPGTAGKHWPQPGRKATTRRSGIWREAVS